MKTHESRITNYQSRLVVVAAVLIAAPRPAEAQMFSYGGDRPQAVQSLSAAYHLIDFKYDGDGTPQPSFEYEGPAYGIAYTRPNFAAAIAYGRDSEDAERDLRMLDASLITWGELHFGGRGRGGLFVPIAIHTNYRRVAPRGSENSIVDSFNISVLGLGAGLGYSVLLGGKVRIESRVTPVIGLALRAFGDSAGSSRLVDAAVHLHTLRLVRQFGLSAGYAFRTQVWNVGASDLLQDLQDDLLDYAGTDHAVTLGINW